MQNLFFIAPLQMKTVLNESGSEPAAVRRTLRDDYVNLISSDGHIFTLKRQYVEYSETLMKMIEGQKDGEASINAELLKFVCVYLTVRHQMKDSWFEVERHEHGSLIEISEKVVNGKLEPNISLNEATDYGIVRKSVLAKAGTDPLKLLLSMQYYGLCINSIPHERHLKHKEDSRGDIPFLDNDFNMIKFKTYTPTTVPQRFLGIELAVKVDEYAIESFAELMPNLHEKCRAGGKDQPINELCEREAKNWQLRMQNFINMCRALETRQFVKQAKYECTQCSASYVNKSKLVDHFKKKHLPVESSDEEDEEVPPSKKPKKERPKYRCPVQGCTAAPMDSSKVSRHLKSRAHNYTDDQVETAKKRMGIKAYTSRSRHFNEE